MTNTEIKKFALSLVEVDTVEDVIKILKQSNFWDDNTAWREYGDDPMNYSTIGNQQNNAAYALVETLVNSVDAVLMRECLKRGIEPDGEGAPQSIAEAQKTFFDIHDGKLANSDQRQRAELAKNIFLVATGSKQNPSLSIIDKGEGQIPERMPETILSLTKANKIKIPFVQGKFGMGGSGVLRFCSPEHQQLQLIISKRNSDIPSQNEPQEMWGVTIIRRENHKEGIPHPPFTYLAPKKQVLSFSAPELPLLPKSYPDALGKPLKSGTYMKLYEYDIGPGLRTFIGFDLYERLALLLPNVALPIRMCERRKDYTAHSYDKTLSGLSVRLDEDRSNNLEPEFPSTGEMNVDGEKFVRSIYVFKKGKKKEYAGNAGVIFSINGQTHGDLSKVFFERQAVGMSYLSDSILVMIDCSKVSFFKQEKLFMASRDRLADTPFKKSIERNLEGIIKNHEGLRELRNKRQKEATAEKLQDSKPMTDILENAIKKSPTLSGFLLHGDRIKDPFKMDGVAAKKEFNGKKFPTFFNLTKELLKDNPKLCAINREFKIQYETDAENDYFDRNKDPGKWTLEHNDKAVQNCSFGLFNGSCNP